MLVPLGCSHDEHYLIECVTSPISHRAGDTDGPSGPQQTGTVDVSVTDLKWYVNDSHIHRHIPESISPFSGYYHAVPVR